MIEQIIKNLFQKGIEVENLLADVDYSSDDNYGWLEKRGIKSYIPPHGTYKGGPENYTYHKEVKYWECHKGKNVTFRKQRLEKER